MSGFIYLWFDRKHKRYYVGSHWGAEDDNYICSSTWMRNSYKRRPQDFKRRVISRIDTSRNDLLKEEQRWFNMIKPEERRIKYYNLNLSVHFSSIHTLTKEQKEHLRNCAKKQFSTKESRILHGIATSKGMKSHPIKPKSEEAKQKIREAVILQHKRQKENGIDEIRRQKISAAQLGKKRGPRPQWVKDKISATKQLKRKIHYE